MDCHFWFFFVLCRPNTCLVCEQFFVVLFLFKFREAENNLCLTDPVVDFVMNQWKSCAEIWQCCVSGRCHGLWIISLTNTWSWSLAPTKIKTQKCLLCHRPSYWNRIQRVLPSVSRYQNRTCYPHPFFLYFIFSNLIAFRKLQSSASLVLSHRIWQTCVYIHARVQVLLVGTVAFFSETSIPSSSSLL